MSARAKEMNIDRRRRQLLQAAGVGLSAVVLPGLFGKGIAQAAVPTKKIVMRAIPRTGEKVPAIGLGTYMTFDLKPGASRERLREVLRRFYAGGGRVVDTSPRYGMAEVNVGDLATALGIGAGLFISNGSWATGEWQGDDSQAQAQLRRSMERLWRERIDVVQCNNLVNAPAVMKLLREWKKEGRIRYLGLTYDEPSFSGPLLEWMKKGEVDFVQVPYSIHTRVAEERILPMARDQGIAVQASMPFEKARLFKLVAGRQLPAFAREIGCRNWAQFFLKWVIAHPSITCAIPATSDPEHQSENIGALTGPLPDKAFRLRMLKHLEALPGFSKLAQMPAYPGKTFAGVATY